MTVAVVVMILMILMIAILATLVGVLTLLFIGMTRMVLFPRKGRYGLYLSRRRGGLKRHGLVQKRDPGWGGHNHSAHGLDIPDHGCTCETSDEDGNENDHNLFN
jgi:hypothetical protein